MMNQHTEQRYRTSWNGTQKTTSLWTQERLRNSSTLEDPRFMTYSHWQKSCRTACGEDRPWKSGRGLIYLVNLHPNHCKYCRRPVGIHMDQTFTKKTIKFGRGKIMIWGHIQFGVVRAICRVCDYYIQVCVATAVFLLILEHQYRTALWNMTCFLCLIWF